MMEMRWRRALVVGAIALVAALVSRHFGWWPITVASSVILGVIVLCMALVGFERTGWPLSWFIDDE